MSAVGLLGLRDELVTGEQWRLDPFRNTAAMSACLDVFCLQPSTGTCKGRAKHIHKHKHTNRNMLGWHTSSHPQLYVWTQGKPWMLWRISSNVNGLVRALSQYQPLQTREDWPIEYVLHTHIYSATTSSLHSVTLTNKAGDTLMSTNPLNGPKPTMN